MAGLEVEGMLPAVLFYVLEWRSAQLAMFHLESERRIHRRCCGDLLQDGQHRRMRAFEVSIPWATLQVVVLQVQAEVLPPVAMGAVGRW
jgi:hypothetical protein